MLSVIDVITKEAYSLEHDADIIAISIIVADVVDGLYSSESLSEKIVSFNIGDDVGSVAEAIRGLADSLEA